MDSQFFSKAVFKFVKKPETRWQLKKDYPQLFFYPFMKPDEYALFEEICRNKKVFLEYGSGGSTIHFLKKNKKVFSVESNPEFYRFMSSIKLVSSATGKNLHYKFIDLGPTNKWGDPLTRDSEADWPEYYAGIWRDIDPVKDKVDVVFIDGRFRVCCCLYSLLKALEYNWRETIFIMHDFTKREQYKTVLEFLDEYKSTTTLAAFRIKENVNVADVKSKLEEFALVTK